MPFKTGARKGDPSGDAPSVFSIRNKIRDVKSDTGYAAPKNKNGVSQVPDEMTPGRDVRNALVSTPDTSVAQPDGIVKERYSYAGERAETADLQMDVRDTTSGEITPNMDDEARAEILRQKKIRVAAYDGRNPVNGAQIIRLKGKYTSEANEILRTLARNCGVINRSYYNSDVDLEFKYSMRSVRESINKQSVRGSNAEDFGKMLTLLPQICKNSVEIEAHTDKYIDTKRMDPNLKEVHVLIGAFSDSLSVIPVQLEIKEYKPETKMDNKLYVTITMKNEAGISSRVNAASWASTGTHNTPASNFSVADLFELVKEYDPEFLPSLPASQNK